MVLVYDVPRYINMNVEVKLSYRWKGPYAVDRISQKEGKGGRTFFLKTLDGIPLPGTFNVTRIKKFFKTKEGHWMPTDQDMDFILGNPEREPKETDEEMETEQPIPGRPGPKVRRESGSTTTASSEENDDEEPGPITRARKQKREGGGLPQGEEEVVVAPPGAKGQPFEIVIPTKRREQ